MGADNQIYAVAQGPLAVTGFASQGKAETVTQGVPTTGRIPNGALVEREAPGRFADEKVLVLELRNPDFNTAVSVADAINAYTQQRYGMKVAREDDLRTVMLQRPFYVGAARFMAEIGELPVSRRAGARRHRRAHRHDRDRQGRADLDGRGRARQPHGARHRDAEGLPAPAVLAAARRSSRRRPRSPPSEKGGNLAIVRGTNLQTLVGGLNRIGLKPTGIIAILQAIKSAGALQADLVVQ